MKNQYKMGISVEKWLVMVSLGLISFLLGFIPYLLLSKISSWSRILSNRGYHLFLTILSCGGAGVLLATTLVHMLPENRESLSSSKYVQENVDSHLPLAEILTLSGFALIYLIEEIAGLIMSGSNLVHVHHGHSHCPNPEEYVETQSTILTHNSMTHGMPSGSGHRPSFLNVNCNNLALDVEGNSDLNNDFVKEGQEKTNINVASKESKDLNKLRIGSFLALIALSFHAIMEGIAIGIQNPSNLWMMFGAIASHKFVMSFCMGMELCASKAKLLTFIGSITLFSILSPIGILIGSYLTSDDEGSTKSLTICILEGFATGTLLYVVFYEILNREKDRKLNILSQFNLTGLIQFMSIFIGLALMICLLTLVSHDHGHEDEHDHDHEEGEEHEDHLLVQNYKLLQKLFT